MNRSLILEIYRSKAKSTKGQFGYRIYSGGRITNVPGELYKRKSTMLRALENGVLYAWVKQADGRYVSPLVCGPVKFITVRDLTK